MIQPSVVGLTNLAELTCSCPTCAHWSNLGPWPVCRDLELACKADLVTSPWQIPSKRQLLAVTSGGN